MTTIDTTRLAASELIHALAATPSADPRRAGLRARAIEAWLPLANRLARRYAGHPADLDDLRQTATIGLIKAIDGFDSGWGGDFVAYAVPMVAGELKRYFRDRCWSIRPPRRLHNRYLRIREAQCRLAQQLRHQPTAAEVARDLGVSEEEVIEALECAYIRRVRSLSTPANFASDTELGDVVAAEGDEFHAAELHLDLSRAIAELDKREQKIVSLYFYGNLTQSEIGRQIGLSQMHISRLLRNALSALHDRLTA